jgi:hypothetical protein
VHPCCARRRARCRTAGDKGVRVEVTDRSGDGVPVLHPASEAAGGEEESGRGMRLVDALSARWGYQRSGGLATTWFELCDLLQPMQHSAVSGMSVNSPDAQLPGS